MQVLVIGGGGREHALAWQMAQSERVSRVWVAPGNAGTSVEPGLSNVALNPDDIPAMIAFVRNQDIALTVVGPEAPLVAGLVDAFEAEGLTIFGPTAAAAQLEGSKAFSKAFLARHQIPTAAYGVFTEVTPALEYIAQQGAPIVVKADGLAAGKGVILAQTEVEAATAVQEMLADNRFGAAGSRVVIEEFLQGEEVSFIVMVDGLDVLPMATSQDHKAAFDGDQGPNTGGMGAYSPAPLVTAELEARIMEQVIQPTVAGLQADGIHYRGFLYAGLMIDAEGNPKVLEFNCRFGDPETQPIMMRLKSDLVSHCLAACSGQLAHETALWDEACAVGVVMAAGGYPDRVRTGDEILGLAAAAELPGKVFHAGTRAVDQAQGNTLVLTHGGRVLCCTALGDSVQAAQQAAYALVDKIHWPECRYRTDIGYRAIAREQAARDPAEK